MKKRVMGLFQWLLPGLGVKRWAFVALLGVLLLVDAIVRWLIAEGTGIHINELLDDIVDDYFPPAYLTWILAIVGLGLTFSGVWLWLRSTVRVARNRGRDGVRSALTGMRLQQGYKIVAIGGGTGLSTMLRGLKRRTSNLTAVVT
ncbi:MAG: 2-phospho-L-lactate transferase CofD family protein, partial [Candidatus Tumulicola sp.]